MAEICICVQPPLNFSVKAEVFKLKKQSAVIAGSTALVPVTFYTASVSSDLIYDVPLHQEPLFVSKSVRGPPVS